MLQKTTVVDSSIPLPLPIFPSGLSSRLPKPRRARPAALPRYSERCYACDASAVGVRDRRPEGLFLESACARHADPTLRSFAACVYCSEPVLPRSLLIDRDFAHKGCHAEACR